MPIHLSTGLFQSVSRLGKLDNTLIFCSNRNEPITIIIQIYFGHVNHILTITSNFQRSLAQHRTTPKCYHNIASGPEDTI